MNYNLTLLTPPATEPISLTEVKNYLKISDYADTSAGLAISESILIATRTPATVNGLSVDVLGYAATVELNVGTILALGTLNVKIQESNDDVTWVDWGPFDEVTPATDNQTLMIQYTGEDKYIRVVGVLTVANADYSVNIVLNQGYTSEDIYLTSLITAARLYCEEYQSRAYVTQTWELALDSWPCRVIDIPKGCLQSIDSIKYTDSNSAITTMTENTDYIYSTRGILGRLTTPYGKPWPSFTPYPIDAIVIEFTCGYGDDATDVPVKIIQALKLLVGHWHFHRIPVDETGGNVKEVEFTLSALLWMDRIVNI